MESAAWKDDRRFRLMTIDNGTFSFTDLMFNTPGKPPSKGVVAPPSPLPPDNTSITGELFSIAFLIPAAGTASSSLTDKAIACPFFFLQNSSLAASAAVFVSNEYHQSFICYYIYLLIKYETALSNDLSTVLPQLLTSETGLQATLSTPCWTSATNIHTTVSRNNIWCRMAYSMQGTPCSVCVLTNAFCDCRICPQCQAWFSAIAWKFIWFLRATDPDSLLQALRLMWWSAAPQWCWPALQVLARALWLRPQKELPLQKAMPNSELCCFMSAPMPKLPRYTLPAY